MPKFAVKFDPFLPRASWNPEPGPPRKMAMPCVGKVSSSWNPGGHCPFAGSIQYDGERWCKKHHPLTRAELEAHKIDRMFTELRHIGFEVHSARR